VGVHLANKIGGADERDLFRKEFFNDEEMNPDRKDNYLAAADWFTRSLEVADANHRNLIRSHPVIFRSSPGLALMQYAAAVERDGIFDEKAKSAWSGAFDYWTGPKFGRASFAAPDGIQVQLEYAPEELVGLSDQQRHWTGRFQELVNYAYWRMRADTERADDLLSARRNIYLGDQAYGRGDLRSARSFYEEGMGQWDRVLHEKPQLLDAQETLEEGVNVLLRYRDILTQFGEADQVEGLEEGKQLPDDFPLKIVWDLYSRTIRDMRLNQETLAEMERARRTQLQQGERGLQSPSDDDLLNE
jgi:hypothetical protein